MTPCWKLSPFIHVSSQHRSGQSLDAVYTYLVDLGKGFFRKGLWVHAQAGELLHNAAPHHPVT